MITSPSKLDVLGLSLNKFRTRLAGGEMRLCSDYVLVFMLFFAIYLFCGLCLTVDFSSSLPKISINDVFWGSDSARALFDMDQIISGDHHYRIKVHPLFLLLIQTPTLVINGFVNNPVIATVIVCSLAGAGMVTLFFDILKQLSIRNTFRMLYTFIFGFSFSMIAFSAIPETFVFSGLFLIGMWWYAIRITEIHKSINYGDIIIFTFFGVCNFGITITNFVSFVICLCYLLGSLGYKDNLKSIILIFIFTLSAIIILCWWQSYVWSDTLPFWESIISSALGSEVYEETLYMNFQFGIEKTWIWFLQAFLYPMLPGSVVVLENSWIRFGQDNAILLIAGISFLLITFVSFVCFLMSKKNQKQLKKNSYLFDYQLAV